ncbi:MAG: MerR family transcriptional regulator, partial [Deltaproteobacteria bacterium]|nr:MerR family transcriptional regulator [Deltaproteobacteria bacterium]
MSEQLLTLAELSEALQVSPDLLYKWETSIPLLRPRLSEGGRRYDAWEVEVLKQAKAFFVGYQQDLERTRMALERWVSRHPRPEPPALAPDEDFFGDLSSAARASAPYPPLTSSLTPPAAPQGQSAQAHAQGQGAQGQSAQAHTQGQSAQGQSAQAHTQGQSA